MTSQKLAQNGRKINDEDYKIGSKVINPHLLLKLKREVKKLNIWTITLDRQQLFK